MANHAKIAPTVHIHFKTTLGEPDGKMSIVRGSGQMYETSSHVSFLDRQGRRALGWIVNLEGVEGHSNAGVVADSDDYVGDSLKSVAGHGGIPRLFANAVLL